jgi:cytosine/adenosine deaminase-related metal-dependent hydrolase
MRGIRFNISPFFRPEDVYAGNYIGALEAINAGVTTVFDYSHSNNTPDHANAGVDALLRSGIRAVYGYGFVPAPLDEPAFKSVEDRIADAERVQREYLPSDDSLVLMGTALTEIGLIPLSENRREVEASREMGVLQSIHNNNYWGSSISQGVKIMAQEGLLGPDQIHVHCNTCDAEDFRLLAEHGCHISSTPDTEMQMGMGHPVIPQARALGINCTVGCDIISLNAGDLMSQIHLALQDCRVRANDPYNDKGEMPLTLAVDSLTALEWGTVNGAIALGLESRIGSLSPGKQADLLVIATDEPNLWPLPRDPGAVVFHTHPSDIRTVFIAGKAVKQDGRLVGVDYGSARRFAEESHNWLLNKTLESSGCILPPEESLSLVSLESQAVVNLTS